MSKNDLIEKIQAGVLLWVNDTFSNAYKWWSEEDTTTSCVKDDLSLLNEVVLNAKKLISSLESLKEVTFEMVLQDNVEI